MKWQPSFKAGLEGEVPWAALGILFFHVNK